MSYYLVYTTTANTDEARKIGRELVERRLVACANIVSKIGSIYWWKGEICEAEEALIFLKTTSERVEEVIKAIKELHSYQVPAIEAVEISKGEPDYLKWIEKEVR